MDQAAHFAVEALNAARRWTYARVLLRKTLDSRSANPAQVEKAKAAYNQAADELEKLVVRLERFIASNGKQVSAKRRSSVPFPWKELFGMVSATAKAFENAIDPATEGPIKAKVIDVTPE